MFTHRILVTTILCLTAIFALNVSATIVTRDDERWHDVGNIQLYPTTAANSYEWFYFDVERPNGPQLAVIFLGPNTFDLTLQDLISGQGTLGHVGVVAQAYVPNVGDLQCMDMVVDESKLNYVERENGASWNLNIEGSNLHMEEATKGLRNYEISLNMTCRNLQQQVVGTVEGHLQYQGLIPGWKHDDGMIFNQGNGALYGSWVVSSPLALVTGQYTFSLLNGSGKTTTTHVSVDGDYGYHDHNRGNVPMPTGSDGWYWGRAVTDSGKVIVYSYLWGKSQPAFPGDEFVPTAPEGIVFVADRDHGVLVDSVEASFNVIGNEYEYKDTNVGIDMMIPLEYDFAVPDSTIVYQADLPKTVSAALPYYFRQQSQLEIGGPNGRKESAQLVNEEIDFKAFFKNLGLPVYSN